MMRAIVGVAGGSAAGKSHFCQALVAKVGQGQILHLCHDCYYRDWGQHPPERKATLNYDCPQALETELLMEHLATLREGRPVEVPIYDFTSHRRLPQGQVAIPKPIILLEGILVLADPCLRPMLDLAVYIEASDEVRLARRIERDSRERGRTQEEVLAQWHSSVLPMHRQLVEPSRAYAHLVIPYEQDNPQAVEVVAAWLKGRLLGRGT